MWVPQFVAHALASVAGLVLIVVYASGGSVLTPPGLVLQLYLFLVVQGIFARAILSERLSRRFAAQAGRYLQAEPGRRERLRAIIERKQALLVQLDASASEALFSPYLRHWVRDPWQTLSYQRLALAEARLVGSRQAAGLLLAHGAGCTSALLMRPSPASSCTRCSFCSLPVVLRPGVRSIGGTSPPGEVERGQARVDDRPRALHRPQELRGGL